MTDSKPPVPSPRRVVEISKRPLVARAQPAAKRFTKRPLGPEPAAAQVETLAKREKVPARIAKGELQNQMKCRIWKKLHPEEALRFAQAYSLIEKKPGLSLPDAFGILQSGMTPEEFAERKMRTTKKGAVRQARVAVPGEEVQNLLLRWSDESTELSVVLAERTFIDRLASVEPVAFQWERSGRIEKLKTVLVAPRLGWEKWGASIEREPKLAQKPAAVSRQPEKRPFSDPRAFVDAIGKSIHLLLRNGIRLDFRLGKVGSFDLVLEKETSEFFVPIHAIVEWRILP